jgi:drug/metabolite transporter (DMT)-like permease
MEKRTLSWATLLPLLLLLGLGTTWGSSFILIKRGLLGLDPLQLLTVRVGLAGLVFLPIALRRKTLLYLKSHWKPLLVVGLFGSSLPFFLFALAETQVDSATTGVINSLMPLNTLLIGGVFFAIPIMRNQLLGVLVGLSGVLVLIFLQNQAGAGANYYALFAVLATLGYGLSSNVVQKYLSQVPALELTALTFFLAGMPFFFLGVLLGVPELVLENPTARQSFYYIAVLSIFGTVIANVFYFRLIQITSASFASLVTYIIPVVAIGIGILDGEMLTQWHGGSVLLILLGIALASGRLPLFKR